MSLESKLKRCFAYFSLFPHDYQFYREDLIHLWISERLAVPDASSFEKNGLILFSELLERSIVHPQPAGNSGLMRYEIHKIIHDFAKMPGSKTYFRIGDECKASSYEWNKYTCHLSMSLDKQLQPCHEIRDQLPGLRTLLLVYDRQQIGQIGEIPINFFEKVSKLKVLALNNSNINDLPSSVKKLKHLRYLDISHTEIRKLPEKLANLSALQILKLRAVPEIPELPMNFNKLTNLAYVDWHESDIQKMQFKLCSIGNLVNLRILPLFIAGEKDGYRITELKNMNQIQGSIKVTNLQIVTEEEAKEAMLSHKSSLQRLEFIWTGNVSNSSNAEEVLIALKPHEDLKELKIVNYNGVDFPRLLCNDVTRLQKLELVGCQFCPNLPSIGKLGDLSFLHLKKMRKVESLDQNFIGVPSNGSQSFESLKSLVLIDMAELQKWEEIIMPHIQKLKIDNCPKLKCLPNLCHLTSLVDLKIEDCNSLSSVLELPASLLSLTITNCDLIRNTCQDGGEYWSYIMRISEVFVDGVKSTYNTNSAFSKCR